MRGKIINFLLIVIIFALGAGAMYFVKDKFLSKSTSETIITEKRDVTITDESGISEAVDKVYDAVVMIKIYSGSKYIGNGSGFVYKTDSTKGYILTNYHVVEDASSVRVLYSNGEEVDAKILGGDEYLDVAVVSVDKSSVIKVADIGKSDELKLGDTIFAVGSPVGEDYFNTITRGIVSGLDRKVTVSVKTTSDWVMKAIQVDAAINPGNSGGPLVNSNGEVIGINSMKLVDSSIEGMGFSIKIEDAMEHVETFEKNQEIERPMLGITLVNVSESDYLYREGIKVDSSLTSGVVVISIVRDSGAAKSGLKKGDVITKIGDEVVTNQAYLKYILYSYNVGDTIKVTYNRDGKTQTTDVTLTKSTG